MGVEENESLHRPINRIAPSILHRSAASDKPGMMTAPPRWHHCVALLHRGPGLLALSGTAHTNCLGVAQIGCDGRIGYFLTKNRCRAGVPLPGEHFPQQSSKPELPGPRCRRGAESLKSLIKVVAGGSNTTHDQRMQPPGAENRNHSPRSQ